MPCVKSLSLSHSDLDKKIPEEDFTFSVEGVSSHAMLSSDDGVSGEVPCRVSSFPSLDESKYSSRSNPSLNFDYILRYKVKYRSFGDFGGGLAFDKARGGKWEENHDYLWLKSK
jgi:hypothetical protein